VQYHYGLCLFVLGQYDEGLRYLERARLVDPLSPTLNRVIGGLLIRMGRPQQAIDRLLQAIDIEPEDWSGYQLLSRAYDKAGREPELVAAYLQGRKLAGDPQSDIDALRQAFGEGGRRAFDKQRRKIGNAKFELLRRKSKSKSPGPVTLAALCAASGDSDMALHYLEQAYSERSPNLTWIKSSYDWEPLHNDPRYHDLIRRMSLPD
jgi:tetratricopeptide (TPR) repeat protein